MQWIAHRGGSGLRVENTLAAFANAIALGAAGAELDVHLSRDGQVVVHHDDRLNPGYCRHAGGDWLGADATLPLASMTCAELRRYDIGTPRPGSAYARRHDRVVATPGERIPLLRDVVRLAATESSDFRLVIEIKSPPLDAAHKPWVPLVDATLAVIAEGDFWPRAVLCSFDWGSLVYARQRHPGLATWFTSAPLSWFADARPPAADIPPGAAELRALRAAYATGDAPWFAGFDPHRFGGSRVRAVAAAGGNAWFPFNRDFTPRVAQELAAARLTGAVWSSNLRDPREVARLAQAGAAFLVSDYPIATSA
ncbi:MAG TPA: glycerophosphodiester phosphodiesterase family protein [Rhodanobacteraceae bacterium]